MSGIGGGNERATQWVFASLGRGGDGKASKLEAMKPSLEWTFYPSARSAPEGEGATRVLEKKRLRARAAFILWRLAANLSVFGEFGEARPPPLFGVSVADFCHQPLDRRDDRHCDRRTAGPRWEGLG